MITEQEITELVLNPPEMNEHFCRYLIYFMIGYLGLGVSDNDRFETARQVFFSKIKKLSDNQRKEKAEHEADVSGGKEKGQAG